ncbi:MAG: cation diffusion facilitator family transporter [Thermodesulfobacteriota bacterium]
MEKIETSVHKGQEKWSVALSSFFAAIVLTVFKIIVGLTTGSLGILAEAAHSGLDLIATLMTLLAIKFSDRPADHTHHYGHGKIENISALFETLLLLGTCAWILYEAVHRLLTHEIHIDVNIWAFLVMGISIGIDLSRSRALSRVAHRYKSQALEADALHFSTDIWSSSVVILGLVCVILSRKVPSLTFLHHADAIAAIGVVLIVVYMSGRLAIRTIQALIDVAPVGLRRRIISEIEGLPGIRNCHDVRLRYSGAQLFVDVHVLVDGNQTLKEAHHLTEEVEQAIQKLVPGADVIVHPEPEAESI